ncbi:MAG: T9SS type A sorting domain-containing protein [Candidatus Eiseniibacteriota bacterium]
MRAQQASVAFRVVTPNPVRDRFGIVTPSGSGVASLEIIDAAGRRLVRVVAEAGHPLTWDMRVGQTARANPGVYFYRAMSGGQVLSGKLVVVR